MSTCLCPRLYICHFPPVSTRLCPCLYICPFPPVSTCLCLRLYICLSFCSMHVSCSRSHLCTCAQRLCLCLCLCLSIPASVSVSICVCLHLCACLCVPVLGVSVCWVDLLALASLRCLSFPLYLFSPVYHYFFCYPPNPCTIMACSPRVATLRRVLAARGPSHENGGQGFDE